MDDTTFESGAKRRLAGAGAAVGLAINMALSRRVATVDADEIRNLRD